MNGGLGKIWMILLEIRQAAEAMALIINASLVEVVVLPKGKIIKNHGTGYVMLLWIEITCQVAGINMQFGTLLFMT